MNLSDLVAAPAAAADVADVAAVAPHAAEGAELLFQAMHILEATQVRSRRICKQISTSIRR
jgi:hypothetical protein